MDYDFKTALVTGGAGFVGSHLCERLVKLGFEVFSIDDYSNGSEANHVQGVTYYHAHTKDIEQVVKEKVGIVFHLGEYARTSQSFKDLDRVWSSNMDGTFAVFEFARKRDVKVVYAGSSTKFADGGIGYTQSPYAWTKAHNAGLLSCYGEWWELPHAIAYFYNVYGPRESSSPEYGTVIAIFGKLNKEGKPLTIVRPGTQRRFFTHVDDIVDGLLILAHKGNGDGYALGSREEYSVEEVASLFGGAKEYLPERLGDRKSAAEDLSKSEALGWRATRSLKSYIESINK